MNYFPLTPTPFYLSKNGLSRILITRIVVRGLDRCHALCGGVEAFASSGVKPTTPSTSLLPYIFPYPTSGTYYPYCSLLVNIL